MPMASSRYAGAKGLSVSRLGGSSNSTATRRSSASSSSLAAAVKLRVSSPSTPCFRASVSLNTRKERNDCSASGRRPFLRLPATRFSKSCRNASPNAPGHSFRRALKSSTASVVTDASISNRSLLVSIESFATPQVLAWNRSKHSRNSASGAPTTGAATGDRDRARRGDSGIDRDDSARDGSGRFNRCRAISGPVTLHPGYRGDERRASGLRSSGRAARPRTEAMVAQLDELALHGGRKPLSMAAAIHQQLVEIRGECARVAPLQREEVRDARVVRDQRLRPQRGGQRVFPSLGDGQQTIDRSVLPMRQPCAGVDRFWRRADRHPRWSARARPCNRDDFGRPS